MMLEPSSELTDDLVAEFIEDNKDQMVDPDQYPAVFKFMIKSFMYRKGLLNE
jgi:hypothetical protein